MTHTPGSFGGHVTSSVYELIPTRDMDGYVVECMASNAISMKNVSSSVSLNLKCKFLPIISIKCNRL